MGLFGVILFGGIGLLTAATWWRMHLRDQKKLAQWETHETEMADAPEVFNWDDHIEDPDAWKAGADSEP